MKGPDGKPVPSLVNMLRLRRPVVIVDEAHNARTDLSFAALGDVMPSCIVEFTATPARSKHPSNILHHVSAAELKAADMVKLPLRVVTRHPSQKDQLLADAVSLRADLEKLALTEAQLTGEYLRPVMLIQAERVDACEPLRERLVAEFGIGRDEIKISVGAHDDLKEAGDIAYEPGESYQGSFEFRKHDFGTRPGDLKETTPAGDLTEEFKCAQFLDSKMPGVRFWVRNLSRRATSATSGPPAATAAASSPCPAIAVSTRLCGKFRHELRGFA